MDWSPGGRPPPGAGVTDEEYFATDYSMNLQFSDDFSTLRSAMVERWNGLRVDGAAPRFSTLDDVPDDFLSPGSVGFVFYNDEVAPEILHLGSEVARDASWVTGRSAPALECLRAIYDQAVSSAQPVNFSDELVLGDNEVVDCRGVAFPFLSDGQKVDMVLARFDLAEDELLDLTADDTTEEMELLLEQEFKPEDMPKLDEGKPPSPFFVISTRKAKEELVREVTPARSTDIVVPQRLTLLNDESLQLGLTDQLRTARELAARAFASEERSHLALYQAIGAAYDLALAKKQAPEEFAELLQNEGLKVQERAEMTPVVKLVFGKDYDKTRITEYAAALTHAARGGLQHGELPGLLYHNDGGLKGIVQDERALRRQELGKLPAPRYGVRPATAKKLRGLPQAKFDELAQAGEEFALVMIRRGDDGQIAMLGEVPEDRAMLERASRKLIEANKSVDR